MILRTGAIQTPTLIIISQEQERTGPIRPQTRVGPMTNVEGEGNDGTALPQMNQQPTNQVWNLVEDFRAFTFTLAFKVLIVLKMIQRFNYQLAKQNLTGL